jgi:hypothetical protein
MKFAALALARLSACGPGARQGNDGDPDAPKSVDAPATNPGSDSGGTDQASRVYAHSGTTLYQLDTTTFAPMMIGTMSALGTQSLTDLAIDKNQNMVGVTLDTLYSIDATTANVTLIKKLTGAATGLTALSYVPVDPDDDNSDDILITATDQGAVLKIDPTTGDATQIGTYGKTTSGDKIVSSGDIIGVRHFGLYATVDVGNGTNDYLASIDPTTYAATPCPNSTGFDQIFGLGFWGSTIYGFTKGGDVITIDKTTGVGTKVNSGSIQWYGAGVTTDATVIF